jgi:hypothetical protein
MTEANTSKLTPFNIATALMFFNGLLIGLYGLVYAILGTLMPFHEEFIGITMADIRTFNPELAILVGDFVRLIGIYLITIAISAFFVLIYGFWKKEKWAWIVFLIYLPILLLPLLVITYSLTGLLGIPFLSNFLGTIIQIIAFALSYNDFFT